MSMTNSRCISESTAASRRGRCLSKAYRIMPCPPLTAGRIEPVRHRRNLRGNVGRQRRRRCFRLDVEGRQRMRASPSGRGDGPRSGATEKQQPARPGCHLSAPLGVRSKPKCKLLGALTAGGRVTHGCPSGARRETGADRAVQIPQAYGDGHRELSGWASCAFLTTRFLGTGNRLGESLSPLPLFHFLKSGVSKQ